MMCEICGKNATFFFKQTKNGYTVEKAVTGENISWETNGYVNKAAIQYIIKEANG